MNVITSVFAFVVLSVLAGCAQPEPPVMKATTITVYNATSNKISRVTFKTCDSQDEIVVFEDIRAGQAVQVPLSVSCADFYAYDRNGKIVGKQLRVDIPPSLQWQITN
ncbi:hypothetical protein EK599_18250 [Vibrio sp. T187]|uniref:hypothetical protein n=1 Tax=Vibrio TaxID=662 RepID=UPI0010C9AB81|nr:MULTISPECIES: hypothetical protein [Vibrio]MBW3697629.1 hypothetical protein [Vibrio sp. T187]